MILTIPQGLENLGIDVNESDFTNALTQLTDEDRVRFTRNVLSNMSDDNVDNVLNNSIGRYAKYFFTI